MCGWRRNNSLRCAAEHELYPCQWRSPPAHPTTTVAAPSRAQTVQQRYVSQPEDAARCLSKQNRTGPCAMNASASRSRPPALHACGCSEHTCERSGYIRTNADEPTRRFPMHNTNGRTAAPIGRGPTSDQGRHDPAISIVSHSPARLWPSAGNGAAGLPRLVRRSGVDEFVFRIRAGR